MVAWLVAISAALFDLWRRLQACATPQRWRVAAGLARRLIPLAGLLMVPWTVEHFSGRAFSLRALGLAMIDVLAGWAVVAANWAAAAAVRAHRLLRRACARDRHLALGTEVRHQPRYVLDLPRSDHAARHYSKDV